MIKPRIIIADTDFSYIVPLQAKFVSEFFNKINIEVIDNEEYFKQLFSSPQDVDILIVCEEFYTLDLKKHNIAHIFLMTEHSESGDTSDLSVTRLFKYSSIKEVYNEIVGKSSDTLNVQEQKSESQIIMICSASGGTGKTTVAMGIGACMSNSYKNVLYINASHLHTFGHLLNNSAPVSDTDVYTDLLRGDDAVYRHIRHVIRREGFSYLPPFRAPLLSLGIPFIVFNRLALSAKQSGDFDYIIVDAESVFDEANAELMTIADKVIIVSEQSYTSVSATNELVANINGVRNEKYIFVCNKYEKDTDNAMVSEDMEMNYSVSGYIDKLRHYDKLRASDFGRIPGIQKASLLLM